MKQIPDQLLQKHLPDTRGFQLKIIFLQRYNLEESIVQSEPNHSCIWVNDGYDSVL